MGSRLLRCGVWCTAKASVCAGWPECRPYLISLHASLRQYPASTLSTPEYIGWHCLRPPFLELLDVAELLEHQKLVFCIRSGPSLEQMHLRARIRRWCAVTSTHCSMEGRIDRMLVSTLAGKGIYANKAVSQ